MQSDTTFQPNAPVGGSSSDSETGFSASSSLIDKVTPPWLAQHGSLSLDLICLSVAMLVTVFWMPIAAHPHALADVLAMRVSITNLLLAGACLGLWSVVLGQRIRKPATSPRVALTLLVQALTCTLPVAVLLEIRHHNMVNATTLVVFFALSFFLFLCGRLFAGLYRALIQPAIRQSRTILIVGSGPRGQALKQQLLAHSRWNYSFFGFVDPHPKDSSEPVLGDIDELETILMSNAIDEVVIALPVKSMYDQIQKAIGICERLGTQSQYSIDLFATKITKRRSVDPNDPSLILLHMIHNETGMALKRLTDIIFAGMSLILLSPLMLVLALCVRMSSKGPILFRQPRYGLNRRIFTMLKFRSMVVNAELEQSKLEHLNEAGGPVFKMQSDPRVTMVGRFIRKTSLDELPQLWNVLVGDMSLVGPRPLPIRDVSRFSEAWLMRRFSVPPGITGLWQVSGRSKTTFAHWITLDLEYIDRWSLLLDFKILAKTLPAVLRGEGAV